MRRRLRWRSRLRLPLISRFFRKISLDRISEFPSRKHSVPDALYSSTIVGIGISVRAADGTGKPSVDARGNKFPFRSIIVREELHREKNRENDDPVDDDKTRYERREEGEKRSQKGHAPIRYKPYLAPSSGGRKRIRFEETAPTPSKRKCEEKIEHMRAQEQKTCRRMSSDRSFNHVLSHTRSARPIPLRYGVTRRKMRKRTQRYGPPHVRASGRTTRPTAATTG